MIIKKTLQSITLVMLLSYMLTDAVAQEIQLTHSGNGHPPPESIKDGGQWIRYWDSGVNNDALGLSGDSVDFWYAAVRWMPEQLEAFDGYSVTRIRIFINDEPEYGSVIIWQGTIEKPVVYVSQAMSEPVENDWAEVELLHPYPIDAEQELWIGWEIGDKGTGNFPAAFEHSTEHNQLANLLQFGNNPWSFATEFGFDVVWNIEAFVIPTEELDLCNVTFNVDMSDVEGFDPNEHHVFITGTMTGWAEPGSPRSLKLELVEQEPDKTPPYNFYENFESYNDFTTNPAPWITLQLTEGNTLNAGNPNFAPEGKDCAWMALNPSQTEPAINETDLTIDGSKVGMAIQNTDYNDDKWLISPEFSINETSKLSFWARSHTHAYSAEKIRVLVSTTGSDPGSFIAISNEPHIEVPVEWTQYVFSLGKYAGETLRFAINYVSEDAFIFFIDAIELSAETDSASESDALIYTVTTQVPKGKAEYKYFSDVIGEGWGGAEWDGDTNREMMIDRDMIVDDVWGEYEPPVSIVEADAHEPLYIYPNPASSILNISADIVKHLAVYDITGRMLIKLHNTNAVNVSHLRNGFYIIQVTTPHGTEAHRFHVAR